MKYKISQYAKKHGVTYRTVWNWIYKKQVQTIKNETGHTFIVEDEDSLINNAVAIYARVSSAENKTNLEKQLDRLRSYCAAKGYKVIKETAEIGSGLNDNRPKLEKLITDESIKKIVVEHSDRFARFGMNYINKLMKLQGREIEVINQQNNDRDDLMQDFVSIITSFCARLYGQRRNKRKTEQLIKQLEEENNNATC
jgi:predicted site-specific integrase-resolvase